MYLTISVAWVVFSFILYCWHYLIEVYLDLPVLGQSPCSVHASLKLLIQRIIQDAIGLPTLEDNNAEIEMHNGEVENRSYEDLLATAILNKVVENYQDELRASRANSVSSRISNSSHNLNDKEYYFGTETLCTKWRNGTSMSAEIDADAASVSSLDDWVRSDSSVASTKYVDPVSLKIQHCIEEVSSIDDEVKPLIHESLSPPEDEWQENWLMQKRSFGRNVSPVPVPMLVPNPTCEAKVLIGDREADDTTDLSDAGSDFGEVESSRSIENHLTRSKTIIGGKNLICSNGIEANHQFELNTEENDNILIEGEDSNSFLSIESQTEQDTEYTEKYGTLPRTILKTPPPNTENHIEISKNGLLPMDDIEQKNPLSETSEDVEIEDIPKHNGYLHEAEIVYNGDSDTKDIFKGTYSEREKEKWNNAIQMKNNPYSTENLKRRLSSQSTGSVSSLFGKDCYIKEVTEYSDAITKLASNENLSDDKIEDTHVWTSPQHEDRLYTAVPASVELTHDLASTDIVSNGIASPAPSSIVESSDSDVSLERIYNLSSGNVYLHEKSDGCFKVDCPLPISDHSEITSHMPLLPEQESIEKCMDFSSELSTSDSLLDNTSQENTIISTDPEITELCDKHLVKDILGRFSKSYPNLTSQTKKESNNKNDVTPNTKYEAPKQIYSITARNIPRQYREELKQKENTTPECQRSLSATLCETEYEKGNTPFPVAKSKIKFFESLKP